MMTNVKTDGQPEWNAIRVSRRGLTPVERAFAALAEAVPADRFELQLKFAAMGPLQDMLRARAKAAGLSSVAGLPDVTRVEDALGMSLARDMNLLFDEVAAANGFLPVAPVVAPVQLAA